MAIWINDGLNELVPADNLPTRSNMILLTAGTKAWLNPILTASLSAIFLPFRSPIYRDRYDLMVVVASSTLQRATYKN